MPLFQAAVEKVNVAFGRDNIANIDPAWFADGQGLVMGVSLAVAANPSVGAASYINGGEQNAMNTIPMAIQDAIRSAIRAALTDAAGRVPIQFLWMPAAAYEVTITSTPGVPGSIGGVSVLLRSPLLKPNG